MALFYSIAGAMALLIALILAWPLIARRASAASRGARDAQLYRDQLDEIARDLERGAIGASEAQGARAEVSRRLLAAATRAETSAPLEPAPRLHSILAAGIALIGAPALAVAIYFAHGAPNLPDMPFANRSAESSPAMIQRPSQAEAEVLFSSEPTEPPPAESKDYVDLIKQLEGVVAERPDDIQGRRLLANGYMRLGRHAEAWRTYVELIDLLGDAAEPALYGAQAEAMVLAAGGYISPEAEKVLAEAQKRDPSLPVARYYSGLLLAQKGQIAEAIDIWEKLRADTPSSAPWSEFLDVMLAQAKSVLPGSSRTASARAPGPSAAEVESAAAMSPEERQAMIEGMVARLETRLTTEGGTVEEWLRLINAYVQLGEPDEARRVYTLATAAFSDGSEAGFLREQALTLGVISE